MCPRFRFFAGRVTPFLVSHGCKFRPAAVFHFHKCSSICVQSVGGHTDAQTRAKIVTGAGVDFARNYRVQTFHFRKKKKKKKIFLWMCCCIVIMPFFAILLACIAFKYVLW